MMCRLHIPQQVPSRTGQSCASFEKKTLFDPWPIQKDPAAKGRACKLLILHYTSLHYPVRISNRPYKEEMHGQPGHHPTVNGRPTLARITSAVQCRAVQFPRVSLGYV